MPFERQMKRQMLQKQIRDKIALMVADAGGYLSLNKKAALRRQLRKEITVDISDVDTAYSIPEFIKFDEIENK